MSQMIRSIVLLMIMALFAGCAEWNSIYRSHNFEEGSALIDVKQRAILAKPAKNNESKHGLMMCAEPSPDAMSAYAAELAAKANLPETVAVELAGAFQESSAFVGLRTQSVQLLRDGFYRLCEARINNVIDDGQYALLMRRQQRITVALLAIEQLTGSLKVPTVTIDTKGTAEVARNVEELITQKEKKDKEIAAKNKEKDEIDKKADGSEEKINALTKKIQELETSRNTLAEGIKNGRTLVATGSATAVVHTAGMPTHRSDSHIQAVAEQVGKIVESTQTDDFGQMCLIYMDQNSVFTQDSDGNRVHNLNNICGDYLHSINRQQQILLYVMEAFNQKMAEVKIENVQDLQTLAESFKLLSDLRAANDFEFKNVNPGRQENE